MNDFKKIAELTNLIGMVQARYAYAIDDGDFYDWPTFFVDDCFYQITSADNFAQGLEAGLMSLLEANVYERHSYRHILGQPHISSIEGDEVESETSFMVARITREGPTDLYATGRYVDRYKVTESDAKIMKRIVVLDSSYVDTLLGFPL